MGKCSSLPRMLTAFVGAIFLSVSSASYADSEDDGRGLGPQSANWLTGGQNLGNTRNNSKVNLEPEQVKNIALAWSFTLRGDPWTQPTVAWGKVFVSDNVGWLYALDAVSGKVKWERELKSYWDNPSPNNPTADANDPNDPDNLFPNPKPNIAASRTAPAAHMSPTHGRVIYIGDQAGNFFLENPDDGTTVPLNGANIYMINADNGHLIKMTKVAQNHDLSRDPDDDMYPAQKGADYTILTGAMAIHENTLITGVASPLDPRCVPLTEGGCTFRGRVMAFDADTLKLKWETYTTPDVDGYTGASVWQSTPAIDPTRGLVFVGTGENYTTPYDACYIDIKNKTKRNRGAIEAEFLAKCIGNENADEWARNYVDSVLALNLQTGEIVWAYRTQAYDTWNPGCLTEAWLDTCGPDNDFSHHPMLCHSDYGERSVLVVGQKTGQMRGLNPDTGALMWETGGNGNDNFEEGVTGGFQWGAACTNDTVIGLAANSYAQQHTTLLGYGTRGGSIVGFNTTSGAVNFETLPDTDDKAHVGFQSFAASLRGLGEIDPEGDPSNMGAASCAGRVCGWGTSGRFGSLLLTDVKTGETLWSREMANGSVVWGGAFVKIPQSGTFWFVGSGYRSFGTGTGSDGENPNFWAYHFPTADDAAINGQETAEEDDLNPLPWWAW